MKALATLLLFAAQVCAAQFPVKPIRLVTPYPPGGGAGRVRRARWQRASPRCGGNRWWVITMPVEMLKSLAKIGIINVPYKGGGPAIVALLSGEVQFTFGNYTAARPHIVTHRIKAIAVASAKRTVLMPQTPTLIEAGLADFEDFEYSSSYGFYYPPRTPRPIIDAVNAETRRMLADRAISDMLLQQGSEATPSAPEELHRMMRSEEARWSKRVKAQQLKL